MNTSTTNDAVDKSILRRIKKLLDHAEHANANPHEAATAAAKAASLMTRYRIDRALVEATGGERQVEPIEVETVFVLPTKTIPGWFSVLNRAIEEVNNCKWFFDYERVLVVGKGKYFRSVKAVGRVTDRQVVKMLLEFVTREIDRLALVALAERVCSCGVRGADDFGNCAACGERCESPRTFGNNFRLGAAETVGGRLRESARKTRTESVDADDDQAPNAVVVSQALVLIDRDRQEVDLYYKDISKSLRLRKLSGSASRFSHAGREAGREAGKRIHLGPRLGQSGAAPRALGGGS